LLTRQQHATLTPHTGADEAAFVEIFRVDEEAGVMSTRFAKDIHDASQRPCRRQRLLRVRRKREGGQRVASWHHKQTVASRQS
jgi:hypothetical protein